MFVTVLVHVLMSVELMFVDAFEANVVVDDVFGQWWCCDEHFWAHVDSHGDISLDCQYFGSCPYVMCT